MALGLAFRLISKPGELVSPKVSKNRNDFMKTSFLPKTNEIIVRISLGFGRNDVFSKSFQFLLTFIEII